MPRAFSNELNHLDVPDELKTRRMIQGISLDPRIGEHYSNFGCGYGGCRGLRTRYE